MRGELTPTQPIEISESEVRYWKKEIQASLKRMKDEFITRIGPDELIRYFESMQVAAGYDIRQLAIIDEMSPAIISVITSGYYQHPTVMIDALTPDADGMVRPSLMYLLKNPDFIPFKLSDLMKSAVRYGMDKAGMKEEMQLATFDLIVAGFCAVEMNHASKPADDQGIPTQDASEEEVANPLLDKLVQGAKDLVGKVMGKDGQTNEQVDDEVAKDSPNPRTDFTDATYCKRWNPLEILFDSRAVVFKESRFIGKIVKMSVAEFNARYPKLKGKITPGSGSLGDVPYAGHNSAENKKNVTLYELEIKKSGPRNCILVLSESLQTEVDYYEKPIITNNFSIKYRGMDKYGKIYPMSRAKKAKKPQDDINHYMTIQMEHADRSQRKIGVYMDGLTESGKSALNSSDVYAFVDKNSPQPVFEAVPAPSVIPENPELVAKLIDSVNKAIGSSNLAKMGKSENPTLGQDEIQQKAFEINVGGVQDALQDVADEILDELKDIICQTWDGEDYFKVTGIKGGDQWYDPAMGPMADIVIGDYKARCSIASAARPNPARDKQDAIEYAQLVTSPLMVQFAMMHNKRPTMEVMNNLAKQFNQNPEMVYEEMEPLPLAGPGVPGNGQPIHVPVPNPGGSAQPAPTPGPVQQPQGAHANL